MHSAPSRSVRYIILFGAVLITGLATATAVMLDMFREAAIASHERELTNITRLVTRHLDREFQGFGLVQDDFIAALLLKEINTGRQLQTNLSSEDTHNLLKQRSRTGSNIRGVTIFGADGTLINSSRVWPAPTLNISDRSFFTQLRDNPGMDLLVSEPLRNRIDGELLSLVGRRLTTPGGEFLGVLFSEIDPSYFEGFIASVSLAKDSTIALFRADGTMLARYPKSYNSLGKVYPKVDSASVDEPRVSRFTLQADGAERLTASQRLSNLPLMVTVSTEMADVLAGWRQQLTFLLLIAGALVILVVAVFGLILRTTATKFAADEKRIEQERRRLDTALNNMSHGLLMYDDAARISVVNRRYMEMFGLSPEVVKPGLSFVDLLRYRKMMRSFSGDVDAYCAGITADILAGKGAQLLSETPDGHFMKISNSPMPGGRMGRNSRGYHGTAAG